MPWLGEGPGARLGELSCDDLPEGLSESELEDFAKRCGKDQAYSLVAAETGIDARAYMTDGDPDWRKVASAVVLYETGVSVNVGNIVNEDGSFNWRGAAQEAGGVAAAAVCAAYGLGAAAPLCSAIGSSVMGALIDVGEAFLDLFSGDDTQPPRQIYVPNTEDRVALTCRWYAANKLAYLRHLLALRGVTITAVAAVDMMTELWNKRTGDNLSWLEMYRKFVGHGLTLPQDWPQLVVTDWTRPPNGIKDTYAHMFDGYEYSIAKPLFDAYDSLQDWLVADLVINPAPYLEKLYNQPDKYSHVNWWSSKKTISTLLPKIAWKYTTFAFGVSVDGSDGGRGKIIWIIDPDKKQGLFNWPGHTWDMTTTDTIATATTVNRLQGQPGQPLEVNIFDIRAENYGASCADEGKRKFDDPSGWNKCVIDKFYLNRIKPSSVLDVISSARNQFFADLPSLAFGQGPDQDMRAIWLASLEKATARVRRDLRYRIRQKKSPSTALTVAKVAGATVAVGAALVTGYRAYQGYQLIPRQWKDPRAWLKR